MDVASILTESFTAFIPHLPRRGLNPPHRIKSISMTTFSEEEIKHLKEGGNEVHAYSLICSLNRGATALLVGEVKR